MKHIILVFAIFTFALACSDGIYPDFMKADDSSAAETEELEIALNDKDYNYIISRLEGHEDGLSYRELYLLQCAYMGVAGFDPIANLDLLLDDTEDVNPLNALVGDQGTMNPAEANEKASLYALAVSIHTTYNDADNDTFADDEDIMLAGTVASALNIVMSVTGVGAIGSCTTVSYNEDDANYIGKCLEGANPSDIAGIVPALRENLDVMLGLANDQAIDGKIQDKIDEILTDIGCSDISCGSVTDQQIIDYLTDAFAKDQGAN
jgi:hypothetical protein